MKSPSPGNIHTTFGDPRRSHPIERESAIDFSTLDRLIDEPGADRLPVPPVARPPATTPGTPTAAETAVRQPRRASAGAAAPLTDVATAPAAVPQPAVARTATARPRPTVSAIAIALLVLIAIGEAVAIAMLLRRQSAAIPGGAGSLAITTVPAGARVIVDEIDRGATPFTLSLPPGTHRAVVALGTERRELSVDVPAGGTLVHHLEFAAAGATATATTGGKGALEIRTRPAGASVVIAGTARGRTPVTVSDLPPGTHDVLLNLGGQQLKESVTVQAGAKAQLSAAFPSTSPGRASGWIAVESPVELTILEGGQVLGTTRSPRIMVPAGRHALELVNERLGVRTSRVVDVEDGKTASFTPELPKGSVSVNALPWAEVWIEKRKVGDTPLANLSLPIGTHHLIFRHPSLGERGQDVTITAGASTRVSVDMRK